MYNQIIEDWWRHNGVFDREQASGISRDPDCKTQEFLRKTDEWWDSLPDKQKEEVYKSFFDDGEC